MEKAKKIKGLEKLVPRALSFLPTGLYFTGKKYFKDKNLFNENDERILNKTSKGVGYSWEFLRDVATGLGFLGGGIEGGLITYGVSSYLLDRIASTGTFLAN